VTGKTPAENETSGGKITMSRSLTALSLSFAAAVSVVAAAPGAAEAANGPNLSVSVTPPPATNVYAAGRYNLTVANVGNRDALNVSVVINLPSSLTSPYPGIMGTLGARSAGCNVSGLVLTCNIVKIRAGRNAPLFFDMTFPVTTSSLAMPVTASSSPVDLNPGNNSATITPNLRTFATDIQAAIANNGGPLTADIDHCTGRDLVSFYQCVITPTSTTSHQHIFNADNTISFAFPGYSGVWSQNPALNQLSFSYYEGPDLALDFVGYGVDGTNCFEGITNFYPASVYNSAYSVCLQ
jgi:hypothetical protein